jgi:glycosyltransferase involved in cell wall biosynthesis
VVSGVSVIIPTAQVNSWLDDAVGSVLACDGVPIQVIVVHDGVRPDRARAWTTDPRVTIAHHPERRGPSAGMKTGRNLAAYPYIARLDADDLSTRERFFAQVQFLDEHPDVVAVGTRVRRIDEEGATTGDVRGPAGDDIRVHFLLSNVLAHSSLMFRRDAYDQVGGYNLSLRQMEDYLFLLQLSQRGPVAILPQFLVKYRVHSSQASRGAKPYGPHIRLVTHERLALGRTLKKNPVVSRLKNAAWVALQYARYFGPMRPGHEL